MGCNLGLLLISRLIPLEVGRSSYICIVCKLFVFNFRRRNIVKSLEDLQRRFLRRCYVYLPLKGGMRM
jgi:hypothetical protein